MTCMYSNFDPSYCQLGYNPDTKEADTENYPIDANGVCNVEDDPYPGDSCSEFSAGWGTCWRCGDNPEDCVCGEHDDYCPECGERYEICACEE